MKTWRSVLFGLLALTGASVIILGYYCFDSKCALTHAGVTPAYRTDFQAFVSGFVNKHNFTNSELETDVDMNMEEEDVLVFLHMQKTGGTTFGKHLVDDLDVDPPCYCYKRKKKHCDCYTRNKKIWLFSRFSTGWSCGLHPDWTELTTCVDSMMNKKEKRKRKRRYQYVTILRNPVRRFLSEYMHVRRGATWKAAEMKCNGRSATLEEVPFCYDTVDWKNVSLKEFMDCPHNLAINRQARMLANLSLVNCYNTTGMKPEERNVVILKSAKENLKNMAFFGLTEFQNMTQLLFEHTFGLRFVEDFVQWTNTRSKSGLSGASQNDIDYIMKINKNDILLYQYAKDLFMQRFEKYKNETKHLKGEEDIDDFDEREKDLFVQRSEDKTGKKMKKLMENDDFNYHGNS